LDEGKSPAVEAKPAKVEPKPVAEEKAKRS
jgi:hypothetical protein